MPVLRDRPNASTAVVDRTDGLRAVLIGVGHRRGGSPRPRRSHGHRPAVTAARAGLAAATTPSKARASARRSAALILAKACSIGFMSGEDVGRWRSAQPAAAISARAVALRWTDRVSSSTVCPGRRAGTSCSATQVSTASRSRAPGRSTGAAIPSGVSAQISVTCSHRPRGTVPTARSPRGVRARSVVGVVVSSRTTRSWASHPAASARKAARAVASRSRATRVFF